MERPKKQVDVEVGYVRDKNCLLCGGGLFVTVPDIQTIESSALRAHEDQYWYINIPKATAYCHHCYPSPPAPLCNLEVTAKNSRWKGGEYYGLLCTVVFLGVCHKFGHNGAVKAFSANSDILDLGHVNMELVNKCLMKETQINATNVGRR